jgi:hypothetical protein
MKQSGDKQKFRIASSFVLSYSVIGRIDRDNFQLSINSRIASPFEFIGTKYSPYRKKVPIRAKQLGSGLFNGDFIKVRFVISFLVPTPIAV